MVPSTFYYTIKSYRKQSSILFMLQYIVFPVKDGVIKVCRVLVVDLGGKGRGGVPF